MRIFSVPPETITLKQNRMRNQAAPIDTENIGKSVGGCKTNEV